MLHVALTLSFAEDRVVTRGEAEVMYRSAQRAVGLTAVAGIVLAVEKLTSGRTRSVARGLYLLGAILVAALAARA